MPHVVLIGDSIFDNAAYVPGKPAVIDQLRSWLGRDWQATLLARDGAVCTNVASQLSQLPDGATHLCVSAGGNDALLCSGILHDEESCAKNGFDELASVQRRFRAEYEEMMSDVLTLRLPTIVCTIYDAVPGLSAREVTGLSVFNDVIVTTAAAHGLPVVDLRKICDDHKDYSGLSPIEPSEIGGSKIVRAMKNVLLSHDFSVSQTTIFTN